MILGRLELGPIELAQPVWLAVGLGACVIVGLLARRSLSLSGSRARLAAVVARFVVVAALAVTLAEPALRDVSERVAVTAVLDMSRSVPVTTQAEAERFIEEAAAIGRRSLLDLLGTVTAARDAYVQSLPNALASRIETQTIGSADGTNLEDAVRMALAIRPADAAYRLLLMTDGNETEGSLLAAAERARAADVPIDVLPLTYRYDAEVIVEEVDTPANARSGEIINARVTLRATAPTRGRLVLLVNGDPVALGEGDAGAGVEVALEAGTNTLLVPLVLTRRGPQEIEAVFEPVAAGLGDSILENNRASAVTFFAGEGRVLVLRSRAEASAAIQGALDASRIAMDIRTPETGPSSLLEFSAYDAIVLCDVPAYSFSESQQLAMRAFVEDSGGGLVMIGGPDSFGAGGWIGTEVEAVLPVQLDPPHTRRMPMGALAIVLDSSGSMMNAVSGSSANQLQLAIESSVAAINTLSRLDEIVVIEFSGMYSVVVPRTAVSDATEITRRVRGIGPGGGTNMFPALLAAKNELAGSSAGVKHIVVLTDGQTEGSDLQGRDVARAIADAGITISTVAVGDGANTRLLQQIAGIGGGSFYEVFGAGTKTMLPQIFIKEAQTVKRSLIWEGDPFVPNLTGMPSEPMRGVSGVPPLTGYVVTADRADGLAVVTLRGPEDDPILAQWQRGLGRSVAFTSDLAARWTPGWIGWDGFESFIAEHVRWAMRPGGSAEARTRIESDGEISRLTVDLAEPGGERINFASIIGRVAGPSGEAQEIGLRQDGPGRYVASFRSDEPGSYIIAMRYDAPATDARSAMRGSIQAAITRPLTDEFRSIEDNAGLLRLVAERTGGRVLTGDPAQARLWDRGLLERPVSREPAMLLFAAITLALFLFDVAIRRVRLDFGVVQRIAARAMGRAPKAQAERVDALRVARDRARSRMTAESPAGPSGVSDRKFEADPDQLAAGRDETLAAPVSEAQSSKKPDRGDAANEEEQGMSRLLRAKRRAQDEMGED